MSAQATWMQVEVGFNYGFTRVNPGGSAADFTQNGGSG
jgi:hypothetical protein